MKEKLLRALACMKKYNNGTMYEECYGFNPQVKYDALVLAPGWKPTKIIKDPAYKVTELEQHSYISGFLVEKDGLKVAWAQTASGACNLLDHGMICAEMKFKKCIFAGAVGGLTHRFAVGDLCTPELCISGTYANHYLEDTFTDFHPFETVVPNMEYTNKIVDLAKESGYTLKKAKVFCTDSIAFEYPHLDEIKATGAELIEMETATFCRLADLFDVPAIALLAVSDNSATGDPLLGRNADFGKRYNHTRGEIIPDLIFKIAAT